MRTSVGPSDCANGCGAGSSRQPSASKPTASSTSITARRWSPTSNGPEKTPWLRACVAVARGLADEVDERVAELGEQRLELGGGELGLEVVEQQVVGVLDGLEAGDVAVAELDVALERVAEEAEVGRRARLLPGLLAERVGVADLGGELGRHAHRLLVVAPDGGEQADGVGVRVLAGGPRLERVEQPPDLGVDQLVVGDHLERRRVVRAGGGAVRRHHRVLVPEQHRVDAAEIGQLGHPLLERGQLGGRGAHDPARA